MRKTDYHVLAQFVQAENFDPEIGKVLDNVNTVAGRAVAPPDGNDE